MSLGFNADVAAMSTPYIAGSDQQLTATDRRVAQPCFRQGPAKGGDASGGAVDAHDDWMCGHALTLTGSPRTSEGRRSRALRTSSSQNDALGPSRLTFVTGNVDLWNRSAASWCRSQGSRITSGPCTSVRRLLVGLGFRSCSCSNVSLVDRSISTSSTSNDLLRTSSW